MIIWINGTFGVGKTTAAQSLVAGDDTLRLFDPELVGEMLAHSLSDQHVGDFQDLAAWRSLVPQVAVEIRKQTSQNIVAVQSVLNQSYWADLARSFEQLGETVFHVVLDADARALEARIIDDNVESGAQEWRLDHIERYSLARPWLLEQADLALNTSDLGPEAVAHRIRLAVSSVLEREQ